MTLFLWTLAGSIAGSVLALILAYIFLFRLEWTHDRARTVISFAAGVMLAVAFLDLLPEAFEHGEALGAEVVLRWTFLGVIGFFFIEKFLFWYHCHEDHCKAHTSSYMIVIGDTFHNFLDGVAIAAAFLVDWQTGLVTSMAIALHEIPQEIGDLGILVSGGMKKVQALRLNAISALASLMGAALSYWAFTAIDGIVPVLIALTAGGFIYISAADLIPEIHHETRRNHILMQMFLFLTGAVVVYILTETLHSVAHV